jgi:hypothetical protein
MSRHLHSQIANWQLMDPFFDPENPRPDPKNLSEVFDRVLEIEKSLHAPYDTQYERERRREMRDTGGFVYGLDGEPEADEEQADVQALLREKVTLV